MFTFEEILFYGHRVKHVWCHVVQDGQFLREDSAHCNKAVALNLFISKPSDHWP